MKTDNNYVILKQSDFVLHLESGEIGLIGKINTNKSNPDYWDYIVVFPTNLKENMPILIPISCKRTEIQKISWICEQDFVDKTK